MSTRALFIVLLFVVYSTASPTDTTAGERGFVSMFNGRDLLGWEGKPDWWRVEDGAITAQSTPERPCDAAHYLIWREDTPADFDLRLEFRLVGGHSGVQFRNLRIRRFPPASSP